MLAEPKALAGMLASAGLSIDDSAHGSTVSSLALALGSASKLVGRDELTDMAVAGLLHDTCLKELGFSAKDTLESLEKDRRANFKKHPTTAVEAVAGKKFITTRVLRIIEDHEEFGDGLGFPNKKRYKKLNVDSQIFNLCDAFDHFSIREGKPAAQCIESFIERIAQIEDLRIYIELFVSLLVGKA
jgi:HD-GYP domain-containing protein (c-di-GMP phosphodiesterase class II)